MKTLVLSGGGSKGAYQAGILYKIFDHIEFNNIYGTSVGSLNCILMAQCYLDKSPEKLKQIWLEMIQKNKHVFNKSYVRTLWGSPPYSFIPLRKLLKNTIDFKKIIEMDKEIIITSVDLVTGKSIFTSNREVSGPEELFDAVISSASIPPAFLPVKIGKKMLVDGGIRDNVPTKLLLNKNEKNSVLIITCGKKEEEKKEGEYNGLIEIGSRVIDIMTNEITQNDISMIIKINELIKSIPEEYRTKWLAGKKVLDIETIIPKEPLGGVLDFSHENLLKIWNIGYERGKEYLKEKNQNY